MQRLSDWILLARFHHLFGRLSRRNRGRKNMSKTVADFGGTNNVLVLGCS